MASPIQTTIPDGVAAIRNGGNKANTLGPEIVNALEAAFDRAETGIRMPLPQFAVEVGSLDWLPTDLESFSVATS